MFVFIVMLSAFLNVFFISLNIFHTVFNKKRPIIAVSSLLGGVYLLFIFFLTNSYSLHLVSFYVRDFCACAHGTEGSWGSSEGPRWRCSYREELLFHVLGTEHFLVWKPFKDQIEFLTLKWAHDVVPRFQWPQDGLWTPCCSLSMAPQYSLSLPCFQTVAVRPLGVPFLCTTVKKCIRK